jgi:hypothetical protein
MGRSSSGRKTGLSERQGLGSEACETAKNKLVRFVETAKPERLSFAKTATQQDQNA